MPTPFNAHMAFSGTNSESVVLFMIKMAKSLL